MICSVADCEKENHKTYPTRCWIHRAKKWAQPIVEPVVAPIAEVEELKVDDSIIDDIIHKLVIGGALRENPEEAIKYIRCIRQCTPYKCVLGTKRVGRLLIHPGGSNYGFIEVVDTPLEGKNMANRMMALYFDMTKKTAIAHLITQQSVGYWYKHYSRRGFHRFDDLLQHISDEYGLKYDDVCWWHLKSEYLKRELWAWF
jgi:hypothetical protein